MLHHGAAVELGKVCAHCARGQRLVAKVVEDLPSDRGPKRLEYAVVPAGDWTVYIYITYLEATKKEM